MKEANLEELSKVYGKVFESTLPSGDKVVIREQNGEDDDVISNVSDFKNYMALNNFLAGVIVHHSRYGNIITPEMIKKMPLRDKYISLLLTRIFSFGDELNFSWEWPDSKKPDEYFEDLNIYIWDYSKDFPKPGEEGYDKHRVEPYITNPYEYISLTTRSGKNLRMRFLTGETEEYILKLDESQKSRNQDFKARLLEIELPDGWQMVQSFKTFSPKDMQDLRKAAQVDTPIALTTDIKNPRTKEELEIDITSLEDFFFPSDF